jgi:hypothetical protein
MSNSIQNYDLSIQHPDRTRFSCANNIRTMPGKDLAFDAVQIALIGLLAYGVFATWLNPSENSGEVLAFCIGGVAFNLTISTASEIFYCIHGCQKNKKKLLNPLILLATAVFTGALATEVSYALAERTVKQHPIVDFSDSSSNLAHAQEVLEKAPVKEMWMAAPAAGILAVGYEILLRHLKKNQERRPLLEA